LIAPDLEKCGAGAALGLLRFLWWTVLVLAPVVAVDYARQGYLQLRAARRLGVVPQQA
jgi:hypothetical protein